MKHLKLWGIIIIVLGLTMNFLLPEKSVRSSISDEELIAAYVTMEFGDHDDIFITETDDTGISYIVFDEGELLTDGTAKRNDCYECYMHYMTQDF